MYSVLESTHKVTFTDKVPRAGLQRCNCFETGNGLDFNDVNCQSNGAELCYGQSWYTYVIIKSSTQTIRS